MAVVLHVFPPSVRAFKVLLAAELAEVPYSIKVVELPTGEHRTAAHTAININQRTPVLVDGEYVLWESNAILEYLAALNPDCGLTSAATRERLQITKWLYWEAAHWDAACGIFVFERLAKPAYGLGAESAAEIARATTLINRLAQVLDQQLESRPYVCGDRLTLADIAIAAPLSLADVLKLPLESHRHIRSWRERLQREPAWLRLQSLTPA
jgi:glutathione S-transferase